MHYYVKFCHPNRLIANDKKKFRSFLELTRRFTIRSYDNHAAFVLRKNLQKAKDNHNIQKKVRFARIIELTNMIQEFYSLSPNFLSLMLAHLIFRLIILFSLFFNNIKEKNHS